MEFNPGFRLSKIDLLVLLLGISVSAGLYSSIPLAAFIILFVIGHFFLFCNIIRMSRILELIWTASFLFLAGGTLLFETFSWPQVALASLTLTCVLVIFQIRQPAYHGILWQRFNPGLRQWYDDNYKNLKNNSNNSV